mgnify:CR=1 FL=1
MPEHNQYVDIQPEKYRKKKNNKKEKKKNKASKQRGKERDTFRAVITASFTSPFFDRKVPIPRRGISNPFLRVEIGDFNMIHKHKNTNKKVLKRYPNRTSTQTVTIRNSENSEEKTLFEKYFLQFVFETIFDGEYCTR